MEEEALKLAREHHNTGDTDTVAAVERKGSSEAIGGSVNDRLAQEASDS